VLRCLRDADMMNSCKVWIWQVANSPWQCHIQAVRTKRSWENVDFVF
jgi:hypothetical protein